MRHSARALLFLVTVLAIGLAGVCAAQERRPIVVELFTSQGCSSCPRANRLLGQLSQEEDVIALTFPVDYWDYLGWRDTFARTEYTRRQRAYGRALHNRALSTPQIIVQGAWSANAARTQRVRETLTQARDASWTPSPVVRVARVLEDQVQISIGAGRRSDEPADIWLAAYTRGPLHVLVSAGENRGQMIGHYNVVRRLTNLGQWNGEPMRLPEASCRPACVVLVQGANGGPILAAAHLPAEEE